MIGNIESDQLTFPVEHFTTVNIIYLGQRDRFDNTRHAAKETHLSRFSGAEVVAADGDDAIQ